MLEVKYRQTADLIPYINNSRTHSDEQVAQVAASINEFGFTNPILLDSKSSIIAGHGRVQAARKLGLEEVPTITLDGLSDIQKKAYIIADNKLALNAGWNDELLALELEALKEEDFDLALIGFDVDELALLLEPEKVEGLTDEDEIPEAPEIPITVLGDVWLLGDHRVMCDDSTSIDAVEKLMDGKQAQLIHADPPYGMGKEGDGVANDNLYRDKLDAFQMDWWVVFRTFVVDNGSAYIWGNAPDLWRLWYDGGLRNSENLTFRNQIIWNKQYGMGMGSYTFRQFPTVSEHCLFFMLGEQGFNNNSDNFWEGWDPILTYLQSEAEKVKLTGRDVKRVCGVGMHSHWFTKSQWTLIPEEHYKALQSELGMFNQDYDGFQGQYEQLKQKHDKLKQEFYASRAFFDNTHELMTDIWDYKRVSGSERHSHATPKPVNMMKRVMYSSLKTGDICVEPFGGSGSTLMGAEVSGRHCYTMELQPKYCDVIVKRWQDFTGKEAIQEETGKTYNELSAVQNGAA